MSGGDLSAFLVDARSRVERYLNSLLPTHQRPPTLLHEAMRYAVFSGGKRLRPALALGAALCAKREPDVALPVAGAAELLHAYSLIHDDLPCMDDDAVRRGQPTVHVRFGEATAVLAGDALQAEAFALLARHAPEVVLRLAQAAGSRGLVGGQADDLTFDAARADADTVRAIHARKTAALFQFCAWGGGVLAGLAGAELDALDRFGLAYGLGFQLVDDLLDGVNTQECSMLRVVEPAAARRQAEDHAAQALEALRVFGEAGWALRGLAEGLCDRLR